MRVMNRDRLPSTTVSEVAEAELGLTIPQPSMVLLLPSTIIMPNPPASDLVFDIFLSCHEGGSLVHLSTIAKYVPKYL